ncbi:MAG: hypothetical protein COA62_14625 [Rhodobiaceae bacterium]|nr:MAG: hypothetical protein COA62_14625 [Rhodobiaceae bacterium]
MDIAQQLLNLKPRFATGHQVSGSSICDSRYGGLPERPFHEILTMRCCIFWQISGQSTGFAASKTRPDLHLVYFLAPIKEGITSVLTVQREFGG